MDTRIGILGGGQLGRMLAQAGESQVTTKTWKRAWMCFVLRRCLPIAAAFAFFLDFLHHVILGLAGKRMGLPIAVLDPGADCPAAQGM